MCIRDRAYADWYDAQVAYENAGATAADPAMVQAMDPDYDLSLIHI